MKIGEYILSILKDQGRSQVWLADKLGINDKTFSNKLRRNSIEGVELLMIAYWLDIDLEDLKKKVVEE